MTMTTQQQNQLEALVDNVGLFSVLDALSNICGLKAEHIQLNWQDAGLAKEWEHAESTLNKAASKILDLSLLA